MNEAEQGEEKPANAPSWRPMRPSDLGAVEALAGVVHRDYPEDSAVFAERLALFSQGCFVLCGAERLLGYTLSHPWHLEDPPRLNALLTALPAHPTTLHLHDIALLHEARGRGAGSEALARLDSCAAALALAGLSLVGVGGSVPFWQQHGFRDLSVSAQPPGLASYGASARFMYRPASP